MSYNQEFFEKYQNYLLEPIVRMTHDDIFRNFYILCKGEEPTWQTLICNHIPVNVVDLGCGLCQEFKRYGWYNKYLGVDKIVETDHDRVQFDYLKFKIPTYNNMFVSLFSTECCLSADEKYAFYRDKFKDGNMKHGLVSGFYYKDRIDQEKVEEAGGLVSYQTIEDQKKYQCKEFIEFRSLIEVPSELFGPDVVEVWKFFIKN
jgi:hypothetical protein